VFVFDGDAAGLRAAQRASEIAAASGVTARVMVPPGGEDPDETVLRAGVQGFRDLLAAAQPSLEFLLDRALGQLPKGAPVDALVKQELVMVAVLARNPGLAPTVSKSVADFAHAALREAADSICSGNPPDEVIRAVESSQVRDRLLDMLAEMERAGDQTDAKRL